MAVCANGQPFTVVQTLELIFTVSFDSFKCGSQVTDPKVIQGMANIARLLVEHKADVNAQDSTGR